MLKSTNLPVAEIFQQHLSSGSDITVVCADKHWGAPGECQYVKTDASGRVVDLEVHPSQESEGLESLEMYILSKELLLNMVEHCSAHDIYSFSRGVLQPRVNSLKIGAYVYHGYVGRFHSVRDYFQHSMDLLDPAVRADLFDPDTPVRTKDQSNPSTYYGPNAKSVNSLVADGCIIEGEVENSILFRGVVVEKGAKVSNCVLMQGTVIGQDACLAYAIADKNVHVGADRMLMGHETYPIAIAKNTVV